MTMRVCIQRTKFSCDLNNYQLEILKKWQCILFKILPPEDDGDMKTKKGSVIDSYCESL